MAPVNLKKKREIFLLKKLKIVRFFFTDAIFFQQPFFTIKKSQDIFIFCTFIHVFLHCVHKIKIVSINVYLQNIFPKLV